MVTGGGRGGDAALAVGVLERLRYGGTVVYCAPLFRTQPLNANGTPHHPAPPSSR